MKILYIIDSKKNNYHKKLIEDFVDILPGEIVDMGEEGLLHEKYKRIENEAPDVFISIDTAGFELRTSNDTLSLNALSCRGAIILCRKIDAYGRDIKKRQNLSMFTYINSSDDIEKAKESCKEVPNILKMPPIQYKASTDKEHLENQEAIKLWWDDFKKEAML